MTETEWLASTDVGQMLLQEQARPRKVRLFAVACARQVWDLLFDERSRNAVTVAEALADGAVDELTRLACYQSALHAYQVAQSPGCVEAGSPGTPASCAARAALVCLSAGVQFAARLAAAECHNAQRLASTIDDRRQPPSHAHRLRDIFGNPFNPVMIDPAWRSSTVTALAQFIYDNYRFTDLPILADALEEAGCTHGGILDHCREPGEHVRGCWVVDLLLGKE